MNGLRIYINPPDTDARDGQRVFYSRRADGPYYRWRYDEQAGGWRGARVRPSGFPLKSLCVASWQIVPTALKSRLGEHYLD